jgi:drug/metabolite transporter (DMT)-like permease
VVVTLALTAALCFASASVLQQQAAADVPSEHSLRIGLLTNLVRRPKWLAGILADGCGYVLQVLALDRGPLSLVQPLLAFGLLFALLFNASPGQRGLRKRDWLAAAIAAGGLAVFVVAGAPKGAADADVAGTAWALLVLLTAVAAGVAVLLGRRRGPAGRAALLAAGGGIAFGLSATLTKQSLSEFHRGAAHLMGTGYPYLLLLAGAVGMVLAQSAFQSGALAASLPTLTLSEPIFAAATGAALFGEHLRSGWPGALALFGALVSAVAVVRLARSPRAQPVVAP